MKFPFIFYLFYCEGFPESISVQRSWSWTRPRVASGAAWSVTAWGRGPPATPTLTGPAGKVREDFNVEKQKMNVNFHSRGRGGQDKYNFSFSIQHRKDDINYLIHPDMQRILNNFQISIHFYLSCLSYFDGFPSAVSRQGNLGLTKQYNWNEILFITRGFSFLIFS